MEEFQSSDHAWAYEWALTDLIVELVEAAGSSPDLIGSVTVFQGFTIIERGSLDISKPEMFVLHQYIAKPKYL